MTAPYPAPASPTSSADNPTPLATFEASAPAYEVCILQVSAQMGIDCTPMTFVYAGTSAAPCAQYLSQQNAGRQVGKPPTQRL